MPTILPAGLFLDGAGGAVGGTARGGTGGAVGGTARGGTGGAVGGTARGGTGVGVGGTARGGTGGGVGREPKHRREGAIARFHLDKACVNTVFFKIFLEEFSTGIVRQNTYVLCVAAKL